MSWKCVYCGYEENEGKYCLKCGKPKADPEAVKKELADRPAFVTDYDVYPTLEEVKAYKRETGPLIGCDWSFWENGMSYFSHREYSLMLSFKNGEEPVLTEHDLQRGMKDVTRTYRVDPSIPMKLKAYDKRENLASWEYLRSDPAKRGPVIMDYSSSASLILQYDNAKLGPFSPGRVSIGTEGAGQQGGGDVIREIRDLLYGCLVPEKLLSEENAPVENPGGMNGPGGLGMGVFPGIGMGMMPGPGNENEGGTGTSGNNGTSTDSPSAGGPKAVVHPDGSWICACGEKNTGKFCAACGARRP